MTFFTLNSILSWRYVFFLSRYFILASTRFNGFSSFSPIIPFFYLLPSLIESNYGCIFFLYNGLSWINPPA
uniref:Uncharacterized protein n=1 Tax=Ascaris lumbricoides TaxID=6252 RepID=A0A0M3IFI7_ASCLU